MRFLISLVISLCLCVSSLCDEPNIPIVPETALSFGWIPDPDGARRFAKTLPAERELEKINLVKADNGKDVLLYRHVVECIKQNKTLSDRWLKNGRLRSYNQGSVGSCTGHGTAAALNCTIAVQLLIDGNSELFMPAAADALYGLGREKGNMLRSGDGCCGFMLAEAITEYGTLYRQIYPPEGQKEWDLTEYDETRCRQFGSKGVGQTLKKYALERLAVTVTEVNTAEEAWGLIGNGYAINVCSNQGFTTKRNSEGVCTPKGSWSHSMAVIGRRTASDGKKLFLIQNSWGDENPSGPLWEDQPYGSFFIDFSVMNKMLSQGDSFAYSEVKGFERRELKDYGTKEFICVNLRCYYYCSERLLSFSDAIYDRKRRKIAGRIVP